MLQLERKKVVMFSLGSIIEKAACLFSRPQVNTEEGDVMSKVKSTKARFTEPISRREIDPEECPVGTIGAVTDGVYIVRARVCHDEKWGRYLWADYPEDENAVLFSTIMNGGNKDLIRMLLPDAFYNDEKMTKQHDLFNQESEYDRSLSDMYSIGTDPLDEWDSEEIYQIDDVMEEHDEAASIVCDRMFDSSRSNSDFEMISDDRQTEIASGIITEIQRCIDNKWESTWMMYDNELEANFAQHIWPNTLRISDRSVRFYVADSSSEKKTENETQYIDDDCEYGLGNFRSYQNKSQLPVLLAIAGEPSPPDIKTFSHN